MSSTILTVVEHVTKIRITIAPPNLPPKVVVVKQTSQAGGSVAGVASFKGRTGSVVPANGDYTAAQVGADAAGSAAAALVSARSYTDALGASVTTALAGKSNTGHGHSAGDVSGLGYFATGTDAANLTGTINAGRIADGSLAQAKVTGLVTLLGTLAPLASPAFTGVPTAPTATAGTNTTQVATTAFVRGEVAALIAASPGALDTLDELAAALGDDPNFATTITTLIGTKADAVHSHAISDVTGLTTALAGKETAGAAATALASANSYTDALSASVTTALAGKAATSHTHSISAVTGLQDALDGKEVSGAAAAALTSANSYTDALASSVSSALAGKAAVSHTHAISDVTDLSTTLAGKSPTAGSASLVTVGTITTGVWQGTAIEDTYIASAATWNGKEPGRTEVTKAEAEAGSLTDIRSWSPLRVAQAIAALAGGGGGGGTKTLCKWIATEKGQPPASGFATRDTQNSVPLLNCADGVTSSIALMDWIPQGANLASGVDVTLVFAGSATSGGVRCDVAFEAMTTAISSDSFDTATAGTANTGGTAWVPFSVTIRCTALDSLAAGGLFRVLVRRLGTDGADTYAATAGLLAVKIDQVA